MNTGTSNGFSVRWVIAVLCATAIVLAFGMGAKGIADDIFVMEDDALSVESDAQGVDAAFESQQEVAPEPQDESPSAGTIEYVDEKGEPASVALSECTDLAQGKTKDVTLKSGWYYVSKNTKIKNRGRVEGDVKLILLDGAKLDWQGGIRVDENDKITIYAQQEGTGELNADHGDATSEDAGIGSNKNHNGGTITICGGRVTARGGEDGAGIGCGSYEDHNNAHNGGTITIFGGDVKAYGKEFGAGIGGGECCSGGTITIYGGKVYARGGNYFGLTSSGSGAGIGGGNYGNSGIIEILGGEVTAEGRDYSAGIGGGSFAPSESITIENATVTATSKEYAAAIGGGAGKSAGSIVIRNSHVTAKASEGAGIGAGDGVLYSAGGDGGDVVIEGNSVVDAQSTDGGSAIGHSDDTKRSCGTLALDDCLRVIDLDGKQGKVASVDKRVDRCFHSDHARVEPCKHEETYYEHDDQTHSLRCKHCAALCERATPHHLDQDGRCTDCGFENGERAVAFDSPHCGVDGRVELVFRVKGPFSCADDRRFDDARLEVEIGGKNARSMTIERKDAEVDAADRMLFTVPLSVIEMAVPVSARFAYNGNEGICECTTYADCLAEDVKAQEDEGRSLCLRSTANMGYFMQKHLAAANGWVIGKDYDEMPVRYSGSLDVIGAKEALSSHAAKVSKGGASVTGVGLFVEFGSAATLHLTVTPEDGAALDAKASFAGREVPATRREDGSYEMVVGGIRAQDFDKSLKVEGTCGDSFSIEASVLSYVWSAYNTAYHANPLDMDTIEAMTAVRAYYEYALRPSLMGCN